MIFCALQTWGKVWGASIFASCSEGVMESDELKEMRQGMLKRLLGLMQESGSVREMAISPNRAALMQRGLQKMCRRF